MSHNFTSWGHVKFKPDAGKKDGNGFTFFLVLPFFKKLSTMKPTNPMPKHGFCCKYVELMDDCCLFETLSDFYTVDLIELMIGQA